MVPLSGCTSTVLVQKGGPPNKIGHNWRGAGTKNHAVVDFYGYPVYLMISEGQRNDITCAIPVLNQKKIRRKSVSG
jgi:hypothetical protein